MAIAGEYHRNAVFVGGGDDFFIAYRAAGLDDCGCAGIGEYVKAVAEREERIRGDDRAANLQTGVFSLDGGNARRVDTAHLARDEPYPHAFAAIRDTF